MQTDIRRALMPLQDGFVICPHCLREGKRVKLIHITKDTMAYRLGLYCRHCKTEHIVDIDRGQSFESRSP